MPPKPQGDRPLTHAERQARLRRRDTERHERWQDALDRIQYVRTAKEARDIAAKALTEK